MTKPTLVLIHGVYTQSDKAINKTERLARTYSLKSDRELLGIENYEWVDGHVKSIANKFLRLLRGTAPGVDALEIIEFDEAALRAMLTDNDSHSLTQRLVDTLPKHYDANRSFVLMGSYRKLLENSRSGQRVLWLGRGLKHLSEDEFIAHYVENHGPLVARHSGLIGLRWYRQVANEQEDLCAQLRKLGFGQAPAPGVFGELIAGPPTLSFAALRARRSATKEIEADEKRHIDFSRSMLLVT